MTMGTAEEDHHPPSPCTSALAPTAFFDLTKEVYVPHPCVPLSTWLSLPGQIPSVKGGGGISYSLKSFNTG